MTDVDVLIETIRSDGYCIIPDLLSASALTEVRAALEPALAANRRGRNNFEGHLTQRIYSLVAYGQVFEDLVEHPLVLGLCDRLLETNYLLTASQAIRILPGETPQALHHDDSFYSIPRPRPSVSLSTIVAIDPFTAENAATQILPGSHLWGDDELLSLHDVDFSTRTDGVPESPTVPPAIAAQLRDVIMPAGAGIFFLGTLVHRGGGNRSDLPRLALSNQYCQPWARPQECYLLSVPQENARRMSPRVQAMLGYSIHPPFMGHVAGRHPLRLLDVDDEGG